MGRKKVILTEQQVEDRKQKYWGEERNARRRERYRLDKEYRQKAIDMTRKSYRRAAEGGGQVSGEVIQKTSDCRRNLGALDRFGKMRGLIGADGMETKMLSFTIEELAKTIGRNVQVLYRWLSANQWPHPVFRFRAADGQIQDCYVAEEVRALLNVLGQHYEHTPYYRVDHSETRDKLFVAVTNVRKTM